MKTRTRFYQGSIYPTKPQNQRFLPNLLRGRGTQRFYTIRSEWTNWSRRLSGFNLVDRPTRERTTNDNDGGETMDPRLCQVNLEELPVPVLLRKRGNLMKSCILGFLGFPYYGIRTILTPYSEK